MSLKLSKKQQRRYNARQLKKWHAQNQAFSATKNQLHKSMAAAFAKQSNAAVEINLDGIKSVADFRRRLEAAVQLPDYCASNLDALYDVLTWDISERIVFSWPAVAEDVAANAKQLEGLKSMLEDLPQTSPNITLSYKGYSS
ncbi:hypothetical protein AAEX37_00853 [Oligella sp. MSHR50489EDL]|uniref:barstar family protein n=1 Tax=Oligella sp. MSHR50489EDL TaxID=3139409 RepID=UPI003D8173F6